MKLADKLVNKLINLKSGTNFEEALAKAVESLETQKSIPMEEMIVEIAENYRCIIKKLKKDPLFVKLDPEDLSILVIDGESYDLDQLFPHSSKKSRNVACASTVLLLI